MDFSNDRLRQAIRNDEFTLVYHPIISIKNVKVSGVEALLRWNHPERGLLNPSDFLHNLPERDLSVPIAKWVFKECIRKWQTWTEQNPHGNNLFLSMNCNEQDLQSESFLELIADHWTNSHSTPPKFYLEVSERTATNSQSGNSRTQKFLKNHPSVELCVDEFGIEAPSMNKLDNWPTDTLKFDRSLINKLEEDPSYELFIKNLINYAQKKDLTIIAEGIETEKQFKQLFDWDCEYGQGYYFSKPLKDHPSEYLDLDNLRTLVNEIGTQTAGPDHEDDLFKKNEIYDNPRVVFGTEAGPITDLLERLVNEQELPHNEFHDQAQLSDIIQDYEVDILVLDENILMDDELADYYNKINQLSPNLRWIIITNDTEYETNQTLVKDDHVDLLKKPVNKANFLKFLSKQSYRLNKLKNRRTILDCLKNKTTKKTLTYAFLITVFVPLGIFIGVTMTSVRHSVASYFSNQETFTGQIEEIKNYIKEIEKHERKER